MAGMYNFKTGVGQSPSFFFFSDNQLLMFKTLKESEKQILFKKGFISEYFKYVMQQPDTLLMRILGVYEMDFGTSKVAFFVTEDMVGHDETRVKRCFDLKGSRLGRDTKLDERELAEGSGLKILKD